MQEQPFEVIIEPGKPRKKKKLSTGRRGNLKTVLLILGILVLTAIGVYFGLLGTGRLPMPETDVFFGKIGMLVKDAKGGIG